jgi:hypothetical protein
VAIQLTRPKHGEGATVPAWWWHQGRGDCSTGTSDIVRSTATIEVTRSAAYRVSLGGGLKCGGLWAVQFGLVEPSAEGVIGMAVSGEAQTRTLRFIRVDAVAAAFQPVP